jgi:hypothetical protein
MPILLDLVDSSLGRFAVPEEVHHYICATSREVQRHGPADPSPRSCDERDPAFEFPGYCVRFHLGISAGEQRGATPQSVEVDVQVRGIQTVTAIDADNLALKLNHGGTTAVAGVMRGELA